MNLDVEQNSLDEVIGTAGVFALSGVALILAAVGKGSGGATGGGPSDLGNPLWTPPGLIQIRIGDPWTLANPLVDYGGSHGSWQTYTYAQIKQDNVTVYGSGVAGVAVGPGRGRYPLVSPQEAQPGGSPGSVLTLYPYPCGPPDPMQPGHCPTPICGRPPKKGPADLYLEIYENTSQSGNAADGYNGFSAPTCNHRTMIRQVVYGRAVNFI